MTYITTQDNGDGFGSQCLARIAGIVYANYHNLNYVHFPINKIILEDNPSQSRCAELENVNILLDSIMRNFGVACITDLDSSVKIDTYDRVNFYNEINSNPKQYFTQEIVDKFKNSYHQNCPEYYKNEKLNISIHIRRGNDIRSEDFFRYVESDIYDDIIEKLLKKYENSIIHIFSWNDPQIKVQSDRITYHITDDGGEFMSHFNGLVHADILLVGASTFSICAGFFNKNIVLYNKKISRMHVNPFIPVWENNYYEILGD